MRKIVRTFTDLYAAIHQAEGDVMARYDVFRDIYVGHSRATIDWFPNAPDKKTWASQIRRYLESEIEPAFWTD